MAAEVCERLEEDFIENQRRATLLIISYHYYQNKSTISQTRSLALNSYKPEKMASQCVDVITKSTQCPVVFMGISVTKFVRSKESGSFLKFFKNTKSKDGEVSSLDSLSDATNSMSSSEAKRETPCTAVKEICSLKTEKKSQRIEVSSVIKESSVKNNEGTMKGNTRSVNNLNMSAEDSPMSKRVSKLIQVCNKHDERETENKRLSGVEIDNDDFQDSFFMNIYKTGEKKCYNNDGNIDIMEESKCRKRLIDSSEDDGNIDDHNTDLYIQEKACETPSTSHVHTHVNSSDEESIKRYNEKASAQDSLVRLEEIFPNLDDIDPDILSLLPADLQEEARLYMKSCGKKQESIKVAREFPKTGKGRPSKSKIVGNRRNLLSNFLIKTNTGEHDVPLERCAECDQMIPVTRFSEHMDFHVAQNLYQELNKPTSSENGGAKRKLEDDKVITFVKRQTSNICKPDRDS